MSVIDNRGRLFGRVNLIDAAVIGFLLVLMPMAYGTYVLFRPTRPRIDSVTRSPISMEEERLVRGGLLGAKFKVKGTGFNPMLRARIGDAPALAFVFENPNSADVLVGQVEPGNHDLILVDGIQEVARATATIPAPQPAVSSFIRAVGWLTNLGPDVANGLRVGFAFPEGEPNLEIVALGPVQKGRSRVSLAGSHIDVPLDGLVEREAVLTLRCDSSRANNPCAIGDRLGTPNSPVVLIFPGPTGAFAFVVEEILPTSEAKRARVQVRLVGGPHLAGLKAGDRDAFLDARAAVVTAVNARTSDAVTVTLDLGVDDSRAGWTYRGRRVKPGAPFVLATDRYDAAGRVETVMLLDAGDRRAP